ncbi:choice-of-anchor J domain-containing protein [Flavobacterium sediminilitoris]|uniref:Choice-of-anchor J domain-containing protein n=1 Tax=Flavobacterium sediminilitoris TaxID=2024526 RepID=A0ABY4HL02_9FLAO|nr:MULTISPECIES: choice-of-anchor J domain-containing protein [Flavobacterium]UOX32887.1 choice-of-anchor J domain-containing protein [Flavobacterium sediminilitoris]
MKKTLLLLVFGTINFISAQVFTENFDGIGSGMSSWTIYNQDNLVPNSQVSFVDNAWIEAAEEFDNNIAMSTSYYSPAGTSNDWLVSPQITLPAGTKTLYFDARSYDSAYKDSYKVYISTSGNAVSNFTTELFSQGDGVTGTTGENVAWTKRSIDLSSYSGPIYIAFRNFSTDMFLLGIDNVSIVANTCTPPNRAFTTSAITNNSVTLNWNAITGATGYDVALVLPGEVPTVQATPTTNSYTFSALTESTRYQFYIRNSCGSSWVGPYSVFTSNSLPYNYGFETTAANEGYFADGWSGAFNLNNNAEAAYYADGVQMVFSNSSTTAVTDRWLFSRPIYLTAGEQVTLQFSTRSTSTTISNTLLAKVGTAPTVADQTTTLSTVSVIGTSFVVNTASYTAPSAGIYYFSFNHNNPITTALTSLVLDKIEFSSVLSSSSFENTNISIYPNPVNDVVNISSPDFEIQTISITDINGRVVKNIKVNNTTTNINVSDLNSGVYFMSVNTLDGNIIKKFVKN